MKKDNVKNNQLKLCDLFSGIGGFRIALEDLGAQCVFSSEIDKDAIESYYLNFKEYPSGDITKIHANSIPQFDILTAGFPCQPFSYAGNLKGFEDKTKGTLFFDVVRILKHHLPKMFLLENVKGLKSHNKGETLKTIVNQLEAIGYSVSWKIINSLDFGLPQKRERWYCVGFLDDIKFKITPLREIIDFTNTDEKLILSESDKNKIKFHFKNCPVDSENQIRVAHDTSQYCPDSKKSKYGVFSYLKPDKTLRFHLGDRRKTFMQESYFCNLDSYSPTIIKTRAPKLWDLGRHLSKLECKRLQGIPDNFILNKKARQQIGNSISVPVVKAIFKEMLLQSNK